MAISESEKGRLCGGGGSGDSAASLRISSGRRQRSLSRSNNCGTRSKLTTTASSSNADSGSNMDPYWLDGPRHDPIATDTNLAEIDFEDFRNEDLAYAFSCGVSRYYFIFFSYNNKKVSKCHQM